MKKTLIALFVLFTIVFADDMEIKGLITNIDDTNKTIAINGTTIKILPQTKIKLDDCGIFGTDLAGKFIDLKLNSFVEAEVFPNMSNIAGGQYATHDAGQVGAPIYIAEEVELKCTRNSAY